MMTTDKIEMKPKRSMCLIKILLIILIVVLTCVMLNIFGYVDGSFSFRVGIQSPQKCIDGLSIEGEQL